MDTPVSTSPFRRAVSIGVVPRYFGRSEGWIFKMPAGIALITASGTSFPKAASTPRLGLSRSTIGKSSEAFWTSIISMPCFLAKIEIGNGLRTCALGNTRAQMSMFWSASRASNMGVLALMP